MSHGKDIGDMLVEEILTDVATSFLGERKEIEDQIVIFNTYVTALKKKEIGISNLVSRLNSLFLETRFTELFFRSIGVEPEKFLCLCHEPCPQDPVEKLPFFLSSKNKYIFISTAVYRRLQEAVTQYRGGGNAINCFEKPYCTDEDVNYQVVLLMAEMINEKIKKMKKSKSPSTVLQFAKSLNPELTEKEKITGALSSDYEESLDRKLEQPLIDVSGLSLKTYPNLPEAGEVRDKIVCHCKALYKTHKKEISRLLKHR
jgi:hypothetical protein